MAHQCYYFIKDHKIKVYFLSVKKKNPKTTMRPRATVTSGIFDLKQSRVGFWCRLLVSGEWSVITLKKNIT